MQTSRSFEYARTGRPRPTNLLSANGGRSNSYELPWPSSPSFNPEQHGSSASSSTGQKLRSPLIVDGLPPTPITAGLPIDAAGPASSSSSSPVRLPSINAMLATAAPSSSPSSLLTPPSSTDLTLPPAPPTLGGSDFDADEGRFAGPPPQWVQDAETERATFVGVRAPAASASGMSGGEEGQRMSSRAFNEVVHPSSAATESSSSSSPLVGLGFAPCQETPRLGYSHEEVGLSTPTQSSYYQHHATRPLTTPRAPTVSQSGVFPTVSPTSPAFSTYWNTDLRTVSGNTPQRFMHSRPRPVRFTSSGMQRETTVQVEPMSAYQQAGWPTQVGVYGLGISLDGSEMQGVEAEASSSAQRVQVDQPERATTLSGPALPAGSTGLTPSLHATRILADITHSSTSHAGPASPSPSLRTKSKQRSDLVRREAEAAAQAAAAAAGAGGKKRRSLEGERPAQGGEVQGQGALTDVGVEEGMSSMPPPPAPRGISPSKTTAKKNSSGAALTSSGSAGSSSSSSGTTKKLPTTSSKSRTTTSSSVPGLATFKSTPPTSASTATPPRSALSSRDANRTATTSSSSSSPWGVFRVKPHGEWKSLAPPGGGQGAASKAAAASSAEGVGGNKKQKRVESKVGKVGYEPSSSSTKHLASARRPASAHGHYANEDKENVPLSSSSTSRRGGDVFGGSNATAAGGAGRRPSSSSGSGRPGSASGVRKTTTFVGGLR